MYLELSPYIWHILFGPTSKRSSNQFLWNALLYFESNQVKGENLCIFKTNYCLFSNETAHSYFVEILYEFFN